mgnify:FL=1
MKKKSNSKSEKELTVVDYEPIPESRRKFGLKLLGRCDPYALYVTNCYSFEVHKIRVDENVKSPWNNKFYKEY